jgi:hypothetical protein
MRKVQHFPCLGHLCVQLHLVVGTEFKVAGRGSDWRKAHNALLLGQLADDGAEAFVEAKMLEKVINWMIIDYLSQQACLRMADFCTFPLLHRASTL